MRRFLRAPILLAATVLSGLFACGLDPGGPYNGGGTGTGGGSLPLPTGSENGTPSDAGSEGGALGNGGRQGTVRGQGLLRCDLFTYACATGTRCALYGAVDPAYSDLVCGPSDLCSIVTCSFPKRCVVGAGSPPSLSCQ